MMNYEHIKFDANCGFDLNDPCPSKVDIGFKFQGKNVLFIIDESASMATNNQK